MSKTNWARTAAIVAVVFVVICIGISIMGLAFAAWRGVGVARSGGPLGRLPHGFMPGPMGGMRSHWGLTPIFGVLSCIVPLGLLAVLVAGAVALARGRQVWPVSKRVAPECPKCGEAVGAGWQHCAHCGEPLSGEE